MTRARFLIAALLLLIAGSVSAHTIWVGKVVEDQYTLTRTTAQFVIVDGDNSRLRIHWEPTTREFILSLEASEKHAATDGAIPDMLIGSCCANQLRVRPRFTN